MLTQTNEHQRVCIDFNFLTEDECSYVDLFVKTELHRFRTENHRDVWDKRLFHNTQGNLEVTQISDEEFIDFIAQKMIHNFDSPKDITRYSVQYYKSVGPYNVNWHDDGSFLGAASIYLNKDWNRTDGGFFIHQLSDQPTMTAIQPKRGVAVYQEGGVLHCTTPVAPSAPSRESIQVFIL